MSLSPFLRAILIGFSIAAPVGPIGVLCIRRTLAQGQMMGFVSGLGAATADAIYGSIAGFGLTLVSDFLVEQQTWVRLVGGSFLCFLGIKALLARPVEEAPLARGTNLLGAYGSTFLLTLTNPVTILTFVSIFTGLGLGTAGDDYGVASILILGVFTGSALWWLILSSLAGLLRNRFDARALRWVNRISGTVILAFGLYALAGVLTLAGIHP